MNNKPKILIADDMEDNLLMMKGMIEDFGYEAILAVDGEEALEKMKENPDVVLLDIIMPKLNGLQVLKHIKEDGNAAYTPVVMLTASDDTKTRVEAAKLGADDFLTKPFDMFELEGRIRNLVKVKAYYDNIKSFNSRLESEVDLKTKELRKALFEIKLANIDTILRLSHLAEYRDTDTGKHNARISEYCAVIAKKIGMNEAETELIKYSSPMHDIGKVGIPDNILLKPGKLTTEEFKIMKTHSDIGSKVLAGSDSEILKTAEEIAETHHEKFDGTGYPFCLKGKNIPLFGRITAIADVFDALVSERIYKPALKKEEALDILEKGKGTHFDPELADAFLSCQEDIDRILRMYSDKKE